MTARYGNWEKWNICGIHIAMEKEGFIITRFDSEYGSEDVWGRQELVPYCYVNSVEEMAQIVRAEEDMGMLPHALSDEILERKNEIINYVNDLKVVHSSINGLVVEEFYDNDIEPAATHSFTPRGIWSDWQTDNGEPHSYFSKFCDLWMDPMGYFYCDVSVGGEEEYWESWDAQYFLTQFAYFDQYAKLRINGEEITLNDLCQKFYDSLRVVKW